MLERGLQQGRLFLEDLKTSWYFRIWFCTWFICAVFVFSALIINGGRSDEAMEHQGWAFWIEHATSIEYPNFAFRTALDEISNEIGSVYCSLNGLVISTAQCNDGSVRTKCVQLNMKGDYAKRDANNLVCTVTYNVTTDPDQMIGFEIMKPANEFGVAFTWIRPNNNVWVLLTKNVVAGEKGDPRDYWGRQLVYHSTVSLPGTFQVSILMDHFDVFHWVESDSYTGWMAVGDIGGFAFFLVILHTFVMWIVALFIENNSRYLRQGDGTPAEYQPIK